jgi:muramoyltetrapeptide carboxypeptidase
MIVKPPRLEFGDTIGLVAPASPPPNPAVIDRAEAALARLGFKTKLGPNVRRRNGFLAGTDQERAGDLMGMFLDRHVRAVLCLRGGYGSARILPRLDYARIRAHPKIFIGYSDITSLHCAFLTNAKLVSFHGPMLNSELSREELPEFTRQSFLRALMEPRPTRSLLQSYTRRTVTAIREGVATGRLVGGNLSILCASLGTPYQPSFRGRILFFEDVGESPYRFDRMLTQLLSAGLLQQVAGVAIGINRNCRDPNTRRTDEYRQSLDEVFAERLGPLKIPVLAGLPFGHIRYNATLPVGILATLDARRGDLLLAEAAVTDAR